MESDGVVGMSSTFDDPINMAMASAIGPSDVRDWWRAPPRAACIPGKEN